MAIKLWPLKHDYMIGAKHRSGFTLIELLITAAIFSTAALMATTVFSNIQHTQRKIQTQQRVDADGRYVVETIARSIRTGNINYAQFNPTGVALSATTTISTIDQSGIITCYQLDAINHKVDVATNAPVDCTTGVVWTAFTPDDLTVNTLTFFINPVSDPFRPLPRSGGDCATATFDATKGACLCSTAIDCFGGQNCTTTAPGVNICTNPTVQPHVTIFISTKSNNPGNGEQSTSTLQTTVASRIYQ